MKTFDVPHYKQIKKDACGVACARMLLGYYGFDVSEEELLSEVYMHKFGTWYSDLCKLFIRRGLHTKVKTININIYSPFWADKDEKALRPLLLERQKVLKGLLKTETEKAIGYMDMGGKLTVQIPNLKMIEKLIMKQPTMIPVLRSFLNPKRIDEVGHYIVLNGFDGSKYSVLDPNGGKYEIEKEVLYYAWLANNRDSDGYLMEVTK